MVKKIVKIDENKCCGCGLCVPACHEGAIALVNGKAKLLHDDYCDGLGNCLLVCPAGAISLQEMAVVETLACACPGTHAKQITHECTREAAPARTPVPAHLNQWPVQIKLVAPNAKYFNNADLLIAADCTAFAYGNFHADYMKKKITIIGCPKLDNEDYSHKLASILKMNEIKSVTAARMEVPCCAGIENAVKNALQNCGKIIPWQVVTVSTDGKILE